MDLSHLFRRSILGLDRFDEVHESGLVSRLIGGRSAIVRGEVPPVEGEQERPEGRDHVVGGEQMRISEDMLRVFIRDTLEAHRKMTMVAIE